MRCQLLDSHANSFKESHLLAFLCIEEQADEIGYCATIINYSSTPLACYTVHSKLAASPLRQPYFSENETEIAILMLTRFLSEMIMPRINYTKMFTLLPSCLLVDVLAMVRCYLSHT